MTLDLDPDDEDDRRVIFQTVKKKFDAAQREYQKKNATVDVLKKFENAEEAMAPLLQSGLSGLNEQELEVVLKGRLHQAVIHSTVEIEQPGCWEKVKILVEDVLQFDFRNAHARWLRGMALLHSTAKTQDAKEEMQRAIEQARVQGKTAEVKQWEADFKRCFDPQGQVDSELEPQAASSHPTGPIIEEIVEPSPEEKAEKAKVAGKDPALQKGFFNRGATGTVKKNPSQTPSADEGIKKVEAPTASTFDVAEVEAALSSELKIVLAPALQEQWKEARSAMESLQSAVSEVKEDVRTNREHQKATNENHRNLVSEAEKLKESATQSAKDRQEASKKMLDQLREVTKNVTDLKEKFQAKLGKRTEMEFQNDQPRLNPKDVPLVAEKLKALPQSAKLRALLSDSTMTLLLACSFGAGLLFMLGVFIEGFHAWGCQMHCHR
eukprot:gnl/MRDRNA2_/MRDRNA2_103594_c0_seq1.p1 gnl/MRDRNA2_/MRDRNA2_103594_c0~~gnl/MRDRNA2_/MRDRNA2_103594_c0_seq1.p1  ORF type:complete len:437 (+),score=131.06 gnl/MRDRNA2_/MRDRNA2_103594_c0_seq1:76-1386(+)